MDLAGPYDCRKPFRDCVPLRVLIMIYTFTWTFISYAHTIYNVELVEGMPEQIKQICLDIMSGEPNMVIFNTPLRRLKY